MQQLKLVCIGCCVCQTPYFRWHWHCGSSLSCSCSCACSSSCSYSSFVLVSPVKVNDDVYHVDDGQVRDPCHHLLLLLLIAKLLIPSILTFFPVISFVFSSLTRRYSTSAPRPSDHLLILPLEPPNVLAWIEQSIDLQGWHSRMVANQHDHGWRRDGLIAVESVGEVDTLDNEGGAMINDHNDDHDDCHHCHHTQRKRNLETPLMPG